MAASDWKGVTRANPCPICGKPDWCRMARDGTAVLCQRVESRKRCGEGGWLHRLGDFDKQNRRHLRSIDVEIRQAADQSNMNELAKRYQRAVDARLLAGFADKLGVLCDSLRRLGIGWDGQAWTFPMKNAVGVVTGIRRRFPDGFKCSVKGSREGLFIPDALPDDGPLLIAEGPTDTAALLDLGFAAVGRPSCTGGRKLVCELTRGRDVVIIADADEPGRRGAAALATVLCAYCLNVQVIEPPHGAKDARAWRRVGATHDDILNAIRQVQPVPLVIRSSE